jgi:hypothetical protein
MVLNLEVNNTVQNKDLTLCYNGGAGGFLLLHLIVLSGEYYYGIPYFDKFKDPTYDLWRRWFEDLLKHQWKQRIMNTWKSGEIWADNTVTDKISIPNKNKIYFWCGPERAPGQVDYGRPDRKYIYMYTDAKTQTRLILLKRASFFSKGVQERNGIRDFINVYKEMLHHSKFHNDTLLLREVHSHVTSDKYDVLVNLKELVSNPEKILLEITGLPMNNEQCKLLDHWKKLHGKRIKLLL